MPPAWAYFDTSVLVKRYVIEQGSSRARMLLRRHRFLSSAIAPVEIISALCRRHATGELSQRDFAAILSRIRKDRAYWELVEVSPLVLGRAEDLVQEAALRTLDAIHVASALAFQTLSGVSVPLITGDARQRDAAGQLGLDVVWVG
jgi:predicted nucleic acid-binding protein